MRWSLILFTFFTVLSSLSVALVIPSSSSVDLERRARVSQSPDVKVSSYEYRKNAEKHHHNYQFDHTSPVARKWINPGNRLSTAKKILSTGKTDADHIYEVQMVHHHLRKNGYTVQRLQDEHPELHKEIKNILNGPENVVLVPAGVNRAKGQLIKQGLKGKALRKPNRERDQYTVLSYPTAKRTAKLLDKAFEEHDVNLATSFHDTLSKTMHHAGILKSPKASPRASQRQGSPKASPRKPVVGSFTKTKRRSPRLALKAKGTKK